MIQGRSREHFSVDCEFLLPSDNDLLEPGGGGKGVLTERLGGGVYDQNLRPDQISDTLFMKSKPSFRPAL